VLIDISQEAVSGAADRLAATLGGNIPVTPVTADYTSEVDLPNGQRAPRRTVVYFPGSTIGNFEWPDAVDFIRRCRALVGPGGAVLIGTDLTKDADTLEAAYNDRAGVTGAFNKNLLNHCNHRLGTSFDLADFEHRAIYDAEERRIEMHLVAQRDLTMTVAGQRFPMEEGSHIRTEFSHKYRMEDIDRLAESGGFRRTRTWTDPKKWFAVSLFEGD
jgi:dimethylhistidine N-methyltransferase